MQVWEHEGGRLLLSTGVPVEVRVPGEAERVLGPEVGPVEPPVWWVDVHGAEWCEGESPAMRFAVGLARAAGGVVWTDDPAYEVGWF
ncbi:hypothetical protein DMH08_36565 [Actinomadura sp. WAC 06369]|nr:hypothetical protein DMH08_36565 [Actinomadura sp. WAC 06369]